MDAVEFVKERNRMCSTYMPKRCEGCPADNYGKEGRSCIMIDEIDAERLVSIVEEWSIAHPRRTRQSVFLKQYPNARIDSQNIPYICPADAYGDTVCPRNKKDGNVICYDCRREFWSKEVE